MLFGLNKREDSQKDEEFHAVGPFGSGGEEPLLDEMLSDPLIHQIARADNIEPSELAENIKQMRARFRGKC